MFTSIKINIFSISISLITQTPLFIFFFFLFMSDAHHGINSSTQKYQSTQSSVVLTSCRQDIGSPPFLKQALFSKDGMYSDREFQMRATDGTKDLLWLTRLERGIWTAKSCDLTERSKTGIQLKMFWKQLTKQFRGLSIILTASFRCCAWLTKQYPQK